MAHCNTVFKHWITLLVVLLMAFGLAQAKRSKLLGIAAGEPSTQAVHVVSVAPANGSVNVGTPSVADSVIATMTITLSGPIELIQVNGTQRPNLEVMLVPPQKGPEPSYTVNPARTQVTITGVLPSNTVFDYFITSRENDGVGGEIPGSEFFMGTFSTGPDFIGGQLSGNVSGFNTSMPLQVVLLLSRPLLSFDFSDEDIMRIGVIKDGAFRIRGIKPGQYWMAGIAFDPASMGEPMQLPEIYFGTYDADGDGISDPITITTTTVMTNLSLSLVRLTSDMLGGLTVVDVSPYALQTEVPTSTTIRVRFSSPLETADGHPNVHAMLIPHVGPATDVSTDKATLSADGYEVSWQVQLAENQAYQVVITDARSQDASELRVPVITPFTTGKAFPTSKVIVDLRLAPDALPSQGYAAALLSAPPTSMDPAKWDIAWLALSQSPRVVLNLVPPGTYYLAAVGIGVLQPLGVYTDAAGAPKSLTVAEGQAMTVQVRLEQGLGSDVASVSPPRNAVNVPLATRIAITFTAPLTVVEGKIGDILELTVFPRPLAESPDSLSEDRFTVYTRVSLQPNTTYQVAAIREQKPPVSYVFSTGSELASSVVGGKVYPVVPFGLDISLQGLSAQGPFAVVLTTVFPAVLELEGPDPGVVRLTLSSGGEFLFGNVPPGEYYVIAATVGDDETAFMPRFAGYLDQNKDGVPDKITVASGGNVVGLDLPATEMLGTPRLRWASPGMFAANVPAGVDTALQLLFSGDLDTTGGFGEIAVIPTPPSGQITGRSFRLTKTESGGWLARAPARFAANTTYSLWLFNLHGGYGFPSSPRAIVFTTGSAIPTGQVTGRVNLSPLVSPAGEMGAAVFLSRVPDISPGFSVFAVDFLGLIDLQGNYRIRFVPDGTYYPLAAIFRQVDETNMRPIVMDVGQPDANADGLPDAITLAPGNRAVTVNIPITRRIGPELVTSITPARGATGVPTQTSVTMQFAHPVFDLSGNLIIGPQDIRVYPKPEQMGSLVRGADANTVTFDLTLKANTVYQVAAFLGETVFSSVFTTGSQMPTGSVSGRVSLAPSASGRQYVNATFVALLSEPPTSADPESLKIVRMALTIDGRYSFQNVPDATYYPLAVGLYVEAGGENILTSAKQPPPLALQAGAALKEVNLALGEASGPQPPRVLSFDASVAHLKQRISTPLGDINLELYVPIISARIMDPNGNNTIQSVTVKLPDGSEHMLIPNETGLYRQLLPALPSYTGGTFSIWATDNEGASSEVVTDDVPFLALGIPSLTKPLNNATDIPTSPMLDWEDMPGAAAYIVHVSSKDPINLTNPQQGIADFLDPANAVVSYLDAPTSTSELRIPEGRLKPGTKYFWVVGALDKPADVDNISLSAVRSFTTVGGVVVADTTPPVFLKTPGLVGVDEKSITLGWVTDEPSDTRVRYGLSADALSDSVVDPRLTRVHVITIPDLTSGTEYFFEVSSRDFAGNELRVALLRSIWTRRAAKTTPPEFVAGPVTQRVDLDRVTIFWANNDPTIGTILITGGGKDTTVTDNQLLREHRVDVLGLAPGTVYTFLVTVTDATGQLQAAKPGLPFRTKDLPDTNPPRALKGPIVIPRENEAFVAWEADELHTARVVVSYPGPQGALVAEAFVDQPGIVQLARVTGLTPSTAYKAVVELTDLTSNSVKTKPLPFRTYAVRDTIPPRILLAPAAVYRADTRIVLVWGTDEPSDSYVEVWQGDQLVGTFSDGNFVRMHIIVVTDLAAGGTYRYKISSADASGNQVTWPPAATPSGKAARRAGRTESEFTTSPTPDVTPPVLTSGPTVRARTTTALTIGWTTDESSNSVVHFGEATSGKLARLSADDLTETVTMTDNVAEHSVTITNLKPATTYAYQVGSTDPSGNGETISAVQTALTLADEDLTPPKLVEQPAVIGRTDSRITVRWTTDEPSDSRVSYRLAGSSDPELEVTVPDRVTDHVVTLTNLSPSSSYDLTVESTDFVGNGPTSAKITGSTQATGDTEPPEFTAGPTVLTDAEQARVTWTTDEPGDSYVEYGQTVALGKVVSKASFDTQHEAVLTNLLPSTQYYFSIASSDASGNIADSTGAELVWRTLATPDTIPPAKVAGLTAAVGAYAVRLSWTPNTESDLAGYVVERSTGGGEFGKIADQTLTTYTDETVKIGSAYEYRVRAVDRSMNRNLSVPSDQVSAAPTATDAPGAPVAFRHDTTVSSRPFLKVTNAQKNTREIAGYSFIVATDSALTQVVTTASNVVPGATTTEWLVPFALEHQAKYWWAARAVDDAGFYGPFSERTSFQVDTVAHKPTAVRLASFAASSGRQHVLVTWALTRESASAAFHLWRAAGESGEFERLTTRPIRGGGPEWQYLDGGVVPGMVYRYRLEAMGSSGQTTLFGPVGVRVALPERVALEQNAPNPFNPSTQIAYQVPWNAEVHLAIYNVLGQEVRVLTDAVHAPGFYRLTWDGKTALGENAASGIYFARLVVTPQAETASQRTETQVIRMVLIK